MVDAEVVGAGDSERDGDGFRAVSCGFRADGKEAPQISQVRIEGWFRKVQRGHSL